MPESGDKNKRHGGLGRHSGFVPPWYTSQEKMENRTVDSFCYRVETSINVVERRV